MFIQYIELFMWEIMCTGIFMKIIYCLHFRKIYIEKWENKANVTHLIIPIQKYVNILQWSSSTPLQF